MVPSEFMTLLEISNQEESKRQLFVIVCTFRTQAGEEDAIIALHEDWQRKQSSNAKIYLSWELLRNVEAPREFTAIAYFESEEQARALADNLNQDAWYSRLVNLLEEGLVCSRHASEWRAI